MSGESLTEMMAEAEQLMDFLDEKMSAGLFREVDIFLRDMDVYQVDNASYLLVCCNYVRIAKERGDLLVEGQAFRTKAFARMRQLVGDERAENLMRNR